MLRLPPFEYRAARTVGEAVGRFAEAAPEAMYIAGGTDLVPNMKRRQFEPRRLVGLRDIDELRGLHGDGTPDGVAADTADVPGSVAGAAVEGPEGLRIGAGVTLQRLAESGAVRRYAALREAASQVANPQIQRMGTLGGNLCVDTRCNYYNQTYDWRKAIGFCLKKDGDICLVAPGSRKCWAVSSSDTAPVMIALGAEVVLAGPEGERRLPVGALYRDDGIDYLTKRPEELLTAVSLPPVDGLRSTYVKVRRRGSFDFPILGVAAALRLEDDTVTGLRLVLGAVHTHPVEVPEAAEAVGERPSEELFDAVAEAAYRRSTPLDNTDLTLYWRKKVTRVTVRRALCRLADLDAG